MPILKNSRHELFAQAIVLGKSQADAYRHAGYKVEGRSADVAGNRLMRNVDVRCRIDELSSLAVEKVMLTKEWILERLIANAQRAMQAEPVLDSKGNPTGEYRYDGSVANRALELLGKEKGMFIDRKEIGLPGEFDRLADDELIEAIREQAEEVAIVIGPMSDTQH